MPRKLTLPEIETEKIIGRRPRSRVAQRCEDGVRQCPVCGPITRYGVGGPHKIDAPAVKIKNKGRRIKF